VYFLDSRCQEGIIKEVMSAFLYGLHIHDSKVFYLFSDTGRDEPMRLEFDPSPNFNSSEWLVLTHKLGGSRICLAPMHNASESLERI